MTTLSATGRTPRCCAAQVFLCVEPRPHYIPLLCRAAERSTTIARMRTLVIIVLNNGKQYVDAGLRVKRLKEPSSSAVSVSAISSGSWKVLTEVPLVNKSNAKNLHSNTKNLISAWTKVNYII